MSAPDGEMTAPSERVPSAASKPKVVLVHNYLTPYRVPLFEALAQRFELEVLLLGHVGAIREWDDPVDTGFRCRVLPHVDLPTGTRDYRLLVNPTMPLVLHRLQCDALISCGWESAATLWTGYHAHVARMPWVLWSGSTSGEPNWRRTLFNPLVRGLVRRASAWVAYGSRARDYLAKLGANEGRTYLTYNAVDTDEFSRVAAEVDVEGLRRELGISTPHVILYCGQLIPRKGIHELLEAFKAFDAKAGTATLLLVGSGRMEQTYKTWCADNGLAERVRFVPFVQRHELPRYYAAADLFVLASREEVWGIVVNEALACGTPVLATEAVGASADLLSHGVNGYVVPPNQPGALAAVMEAHFSESADRAAMSAAARESMKSHTVERAADAFQAAVKVAMQENRH